mgnify:CR=1 FL=1
MTISKDNRKSILLVDGICRFNGIDGIDIGFASNGVDPDEYYYLNPVLDARRKDGSSLISPLVDTASVEDGYKVMRRKLAESKDGNAIIITVGSFCNMSNLLLSGPDEISPLNGVDLVARKVGKVCVMGGTFDPAHQSGHPFFAKAVRPVSRDNGRERMGSRECGSLSCGKYRE